MANKQMNRIRLKERNEGVNEGWVCEYVNTRGRKTAEEEERDRGGRRGQRDRQDEAETKTEREREQDTHIG